MLQKLAALAERLLFLATVVPVLIREHEIGLAGQRQQRDLVEDRVEPQTLDDVCNVTLIIVATCVLRRRETNLNLLRGLELEGFEEGKVGFVEVGAFFAEPVTFSGGDADIGEFCLYKHDSYRPL
jgi:hypothetical protein